MVWILLLFIEPVCGNEESDKRVFNICVLEVVGFNFKVFVNYV